MLEEDIRERVSGLSSRIREHAEYAPSWVPALFLQALSDTEYALDKAGSYLDAANEYELCLCNTLNSVNSIGLESAYKGLVKLMAEPGFEVKEPLLNETMLWTEVLASLVELHNLCRKAGIDFRFEPDPVTGMPPNIPDFGAIEGQSWKVQQIATASAERLELARTKSNCRLDVDLPERVLADLAAGRNNLAFAQRYSVCVTEVQALITKGNWPDAATKLRGFDPEGSEPWSMAHFKLLHAIDRGAEASVFRSRKARLARLEQMDLDHPLLAPLKQERDENRRSEEQRDRKTTKAAARLVDLYNTQPHSLIDFLTRPIVRNRQALLNLQTFLKQSEGSKLKAEDVINHAAENRSALLALAGDLQAVSKELKQSPDRIPHDLIVSVLKSSSNSDCEPQVVDAALGACALLAWSTRYREEVGRLLDCTAPPFTGLRKDLELLFKTSGFVWGDVNEPGSLAQRFETEYWATCLMKESNASASLPWPMGPALVAYFGLQSKIVNPLSSDRNVRKFFGPLAAAEALLKSSTPIEARKAVPPIDDLYEQAEQCPIYASTGSPRAQIQADLESFELSCLVYELQLIHLDTSSIADRSPEALRLWKRLINSGIDAPQVFPAMSRMFKELLALETADALQTAHAFMDKVVEAVKDRDDFTPFTRQLRILRSELTINLLGAIPDSVPTIEPLLHDLAKLANQAVVDNPKDPVANVFGLLIEALVAVQEGESAVRKVKNRGRIMLNKAHDEHWPPFVIDHINEVAHFIESQQGFNQWMENLSLSDMVRRTKELS